MIRFAVCAAAAAIVLSGQPSSGPRQDQNLNASLWVQSAAEYTALATQAYRAAGLAMSAALADPNWTAAYEQTNDFRGLPPAVILDLDETVLDNSTIEGRWARANENFTDAKFVAWVKEVKAGAVPGSVAFLHAAVLKGVAPFYITNRVCNPADPEDPTVRNLLELRAPFDAGRLLCKTGSSNKTDRRRMVADKYRILLMIGDDFNDFTAVPDSVEERAKLAKFYDAMWGTKWFVIPNPMYGSWEKSVGFELEKKLKALRP